VRTTADTYPVPTTFQADSFFTCYGIGSLWVAVTGGDVIVRFAPPPTSGGTPNWDAVNPAGETIRGGGQGTFDALDESYTCFQFCLADPTISAVIDMKAQRNALASGGAMNVRVVG
jgi:hypothetical protein